jgi:hypothetical protein
MTRISFVVRIYVSLYECVLKHAHNNSIRYS